LIRRFCSFRSTFCQASFYQFPSPPPLLSERNPQYLPASSDQHRFRQPFFFCFPRVSPKFFFFLFVFFSLPLGIHATSPFCFHRGVFPLSSPTPFFFRSHHAPFCFTFSFLGTAYASFLFYIQNLPSFSLREALFQRCLFFPAPSQSFTLEPRLDFYSFMCRGLPPPSFLLLSSFFFL